MTGNRIIPGLLLAFLLCGVVAAAGAGQNLPAPVSTRAVPPAPDFTFNASSGPAPLAVQFADTSGGEPTSWAWDFNNDGIIDSTDKNPVCVYRIPGTYSVTLWATNAFRSETVTMADIITAENPGPVPAIAVNLSAGLPPLAVQFADTSGGEPTSWAWDFNNDSVIDSTDKNPVCVYRIPGNYTVSLRATNSSGVNTTILQDLITVTSPAPVAGFSANTTFGGLPLAVRFSDNSTGENISGRAWDFNNDGIIDSTEKDPVCVYNLLGDYTVNLTVTSAFGSDTKSMPAYVTVTNGAAPDFTANVTSGYAPLAIQFRDTSIGTNITGWAWDFNNDSVIDSLDKNPVCVYNRPGNYTVNLRVTNPFGTEGVSGIDFITVTSSVTADFTANATSGTVPLAVRFFDNSTGENISGWAWDFNNDGIIDSTEKDPFCVYNLPGDYTVNLTVTSARGASSTTKAGLISTASGIPRARFAVNQTAGYASLAVQFRDTSIGTNISGWAWDFNNDGTIDSTEKNPACVYTLPGDYTVNLTVKNEIGGNVTVKNAFISVE